MTDPTEEALWAAVGARPDDALPRLVLADWLEENDTPGGVCAFCGGHGLVDADGCGGGEGTTCQSCRGFGEFVPDGRADTAAGLRATADRVPQCNKRSEWRWRRSGNGDLTRPFRVPKDLWHEIGRGVYGNEYRARWKPFPTALAAVRDLVRAWCTVHCGKGVPA